MTTLEPGASVVLTQGLRFRPFSTAFLASSAAPTMTYGLEVFVQEVMAAMTTRPWSTVGLGAVVQGDPDRVGGPGPVAGGHRVRGREGAVQAVVQAGLGHVVRQRVAERHLGVGQRDPVLRALRAGDGRHDGGQVELELLGVPGLVGRVVPEALLLGVGLDQGELLLRAAGERQVVQGVSASIGKIAQVEPNSGDMFPIVARLATGTAATPSP